MTELIELFAVVFEGVGEILTAVRDDLKNRNDRGKLRRPSEKYVSR
jgi:hypothetical protein